MKIYALLHHHPDQVEGLLAAYKEFTSIVRCLVWADNLDCVGILIDRLCQETQCREIIFATSLFQGDCEHPAALDQLLSQEQIDRRLEILDRYSSHIQGVMFGNAGGEIAARSLTGHDPDGLARYVVEVLRICDSHARKVGKGLWAGIMDGEVVLDSYQTRNSPESSPLYSFLVSNAVTNVIFCGYQLGYPLGDPRRNIVPRAIYTSTDAPGGYPYDYFRRYIRETKMLSGAGYCYGVVHGSLPILKATGYTGAVMGLNRCGLADMEWSNVVAKVNDQVALVQT